MKESEIEVYNTGVRIRDFWKQNAGDFPADSVGDKNFKMIDETLRRLEESGELQVSNTAGAARVLKEKAFTALLAIVRDISRTARVIGIDRPEVKELFRMPKNFSRQNMLATAAGFYTKAAAYETELVNYGLAVNFRAQLETAIGELQTAISEQNAAKNVRTSATGAVKAELKVLRTTRQRLLVIVSHLYQGNPAKLTGWLAASRIARTDGTSTAAKLKKEPASTASE